MARKAKVDYREEQSASGPDLNRLREEFLWAVEQRDSNVFRRQRLNYETRNCLWANKSWDGRKWAAAKGQEVFPWEGASDASVPLVDSLINVDVARLMVADKRMKVLVAATEANDEAQSRRLTQVLRWMKFTQMRERRAEVELLANYYFERGSGLLGVFWEREKRLGYEEVDLETIQALAMQVMQQGGAHVGGGDGSAGASPYQLPAGVSPEEAVALPHLVMDPAREKEAVRIAGEFYPELSAAVVAKAVKDLRTTGSARFARAYVVKDRPVVCALALNEDVFLPPESTLDIQRSRGIYRLELLSETDLRERVHSSDWDADWVEEMIATMRGRMSVDVTRVSSSSRARSAFGNLRTEKLFEVIHAMERRSDENGVPGIFYTCFCPGLMKSQAWHGLLGYDHGMYPYVYFGRERRTRLIDDSRGYGEILYAHQRQVKVEWDSRNDRNSISTLPPFYYPPGRAPKFWGPGVRVPSDKPDEYGFCDLPKYDAGSEAQEERITLNARAYVGRVTDPDNAGDAQAMQQNTVDKWLDGMVEADTMTLQLMQQYMPDSFYYRVVGSAKAQPIHATREEIQGEFDVSVGFAVGDLDQEAVEQKLSLMEKALQMDRNGVVDLNEALAVSFEMIDPNLGERLLRPAEVGMQQEVDDEKTVFAKLFAGVGVDVKPGQGYQVRLQTLKQIMATNPLAQERYKKDSVFKELVDTRAQQLAFQVQQFTTNAETGRQGAPSMTPEALGQAQQSQVMGPQQGMGPQTGNF